jgi:pimeloyl-ACP methyl ester carboxylesterase
LPPELVDGLEAWIPRLTLERVEGASHWIIHERPQFVADRLERFMLSN